MWIWNDSKGLCKESAMTDLHITPFLVRQLITEQFPAFSNLSIDPVKVQGHDNRTFRLGPDMLIRMPTAESYALKVPKEQELLPKLAQHLSLPIPAPLNMGSPSKDYPYPFSIYKWMEGESANSLTIDDESLEYIAGQLAKFLNELQSIDSVEGPEPGLHNWYRGAHVSVYDAQARTQIQELETVIDSASSLRLWEQALTSKWEKRPVWIHGDFASGNILIQDNKLSAVIDFGGMGVGDPACDLVIAWTFLKGKSRDIFIREMDLDSDTWARARAWALWKATFELCQIEDKNSAGAKTQKRIIDEVING